MNQHCSPKLCWLDEVDFHNFTIDIIKEITILTGAPIYINNDDPDLATDSNERMVKVVELLFRNSEKVMNLTTAEVRHALYLNHLGEYVRDGICKEIIKMYGKIVNADYLGAILDAYIQFKLLPANKITAINRLLNPPPEKEIPVYTIDDYKVWIQHDYEKYLANDTEFIFNVYNKYIVLRKLKIIKFISKTSWQQWYEKGLQRYTANLRKSVTNQYENKRVSKTLETIKTIIETNAVPPEEHRYPIIAAMRELLYFEKFKRWKEMNKTTIFTSKK